MAGVHAFLKVFNFLLILHLQNYVKSENYIVDNSNGLGRIFDGIGGLSGGGVSAV